MKGFRRNAGAELWVVPFEIGPDQIAPVSVACLT